MIYDGRSSYVDWYNCWYTGNVFIHTSDNKVLQDQKDDRCIYLLVESYSEWFVSVGQLWLYQIGPSHNWNECSWTCTQYHLVGNEIEV